MEDKRQRELDVLHDKIAVSARHVASIYDKREAAFSEERDAEAELLEKVLELVRPALLAITQRIDGLDVEGVKIEDDLVLTSDGRFLFGQPTLIVITPRETVDRFQLKDLLGRLEVLLQQQERGKSGKSTELAKKRAAWLGTLLTLLEPIRG